MLWGCVASAGTGNLVKIEGRMASTQYQQILGNNVQESVTKLKLRWGWVFQQCPPYCTFSVNPINLISLLKYHCVHQLFDISKLSCELKHPMISEYK